MGAPFKGEIFDFDSLRLPLLQNQVGSAAGKSWQKGTMRTPGMALYFTSKSFLMFDAGVLACGVCVGFRECRDTDTIGVAETTWATGFTGAVGGRARIGVCGNVDNIEVSEACRYAS